MIEGFEGSMATAPIWFQGSRSVLGAQVAPPRLLRNGPVIRKQGRCSEFRSIAFVFLTRKSYGVKTVMRKQLRLEPERRPTGVARERSSCVSSCRRSPPNSSRLVLLDDRVEEIADDRRCGISKLRTDVPRSICVGASPPA